MTVYATRPGARSSTFEIVFDHPGRQVTVAGRGAGSFEDVYLALVVTGVGRVTRVSLVALSATGEDGEVRVFLTRGEAEKWLSA
jgi:hypothetical protein